MTDDPNLSVDRQWLCEQIVESAGEAILFTDPAGTIRLWNDAAEEIFGYSRPAVIGDSLDRIIPPEYRHAHWRGFEEALERGTTTNPPVVRSRVPALHKERERIKIETSGARIVTESNGNPVGVFNLIRDVTEPYD